MDRQFAQAICRIGKELAAASEQKAPDQEIITPNGMRLSNYDPGYVLGLGVALGIMWDAVHHKPMGAFHERRLGEILSWVRDLQRTEEANRSTLIQ